MRGASGRACEGKELGRGQSAVAPHPGPVRRCCCAWSDTSGTGKATGEAENAVIEDRTS